MRLSNKIFIIFLVLCTHSHVRASEYKTYRKEWRFEGHKVLKYGHAIATSDNSFLYAVCSEDSLPAEMNCNVTIERPIDTWNNGKSHKEICGLRLIGGEYEGQRYEVTGLYSVDRFSTNKAVVVWWEGQKDSQFQIQNIKVSVLSMNDCTAKHLTFPVDLGGHVLLSNAVIYGDTFDVVVSNKALCGAHQMCKITYNEEARQVGDPVSFVTNFATAHIQPVTPGSPTDGFYVSGSDIDSWKFRAVHVSPRGTGTSLMTVSVADPGQVYRVTSNSHRLYGICLLGNRKIHCAQFDASANVRMNATVRKLGAVQWMAMHNMERDGLLLLTGNCHNGKCRSVKITRVYTDGRKGESSSNPMGFHMRCSSVPRDFSVDVSESDDEFCFYFACTSEQTAEKSTRSVKLSIHCMPKNELKN